MANRPEKPDEPDETVYIFGNDISKKTIRRVATTGIISAFALVGANVGCHSYQIIPAQSYGVDIKAGQLITDHMSPGFHGKWPMFEKIYVFNNNTIIMEDTAGKENNTSDQNAFTADLRLHYRVDPKVGLLALQVHNMANDNGQNLIAGLMDQSVNAVVGARPAIDTLADPQGFLKAFMDNFQWRLAQNNVPVRLDTVEYLNANVGSLRKPIQMRIKANGVVEQMAGPAAVGVYHDASLTPTSTPPAVTTLPQPAPRDVTVAVRAAQTPQTTVQP